MNTSTSGIAGNSTPAMVKHDPGAPALVVTGRDTIAIRAGTRFGDAVFDDEAPVASSLALQPGADYVVVVRDGSAVAEMLTGKPDLDDPTVLGGFHFAPGGDATARAGGDDTPAINPYSVWDIAFRPACADPRGMVLVDTTRAPFWADIYLLGVNHLTDGTSKFGVEIADGNSPPQNLAGGNYSKLDYETAAAVMKHHGKGLLSIDEFFAAAFGVTERTSRDDDPKTTQLDTVRTSRFGLMQATGNLWVWGHDGDPDTPRPSFFGGSWWNDGNAGSRRAHVGVWPFYSNEYLGARGRSDHLQLA
ncbi:MAG: hypothetical protein GC182_08655 [Rhodopseudomonas sp.]|nr:hypothetical protein [Rhodopseudomonas sp.]